MYLFNQCNIATLEVGTNFDLTLIVDIENVLILLGGALRTAA